VRDPRRRPDLATFPLDYLLLLALMMFAGQCGSRRRLGRVLQNGRLPANVWRLAGKACQVACHPDTMNNVMTVIAPEDIEELIARMVGRLRQRKMLRRFLFEGKFVVAIDGTQLLRASRPVGAGWLTQTQNGTTTYSRYVLAAKIVTRVGLVVPFAFEFVENPADGTFDKQDCELNACRRLMEKVHSLYPRLAIAMVGDSLFAEETTFRRCNGLGWDFIITLQDRKLPSVDGQLPADLGTWTGRRTLLVTLKHHRPAEQCVRWQTPVRYHGDIFHVVDFTESALDGTRLYHNRWITNVKPDRKNALALALQGRLRWKIENEGTNTQKNGGYEMTHAYGHNGNAWKNYYLILQISQLFHDLLRYTDILMTLADDVRSSFARLYGSVKEFAARLLASLQQHDLADGPLWGNRSVQIRFVDT
jgi:hypothetical protein